MPTIWCIQLHDRLKCTAIARLLITGALALFAKISFWWYVLCTYKQGFRPCGCRVCQLTLFQPGGTDYANLITTGTPGFSNLPTALRSTLHCFIHCSSVRKNRKKTFLKEWKSSLYFNWQSPASPTAWRCRRRRCSRAFVPSLVASASGYCFRTTFIPNLYIPSTLNTGLIFWQLQ